jgi:hypothetical protein
MSPAFTSCSFRNKCGLLAHSSRVLWWDSHLSPEQLRVFHFVWHLPFDLFSLGDPASSCATTDIALRVIGACKLHHHNKVETHGGMLHIQAVYYSHVQSLWPQMCKMCIVYRTLCIPILIWLPSLLCLWNLQTILYCYLHYNIDTVKSYSEHLKVGLHYLYDFFLLF